MKEIIMKDLAGEFAENKDTARKIRLEILAPTLEEGNELALDFSGVTSATQSFVHALLSNLIRSYGGDVFELILFRNCSENVRLIIEMVADYMEESLK
jgi:hypothetical protein